LFFTPAVVPFTVTLKLQLPPAAMLPPVRAIVLGAVSVTVPPPQVVIVPFATVRPAGRLSVNATPLRATVELVFVIVKVRLVFPPTGIEAAPNDLDRLGAVATVKVAVLLVVPVPPLVDVTAPVVLFQTPPVAPLTVTLNWISEPAGTVAPESCITPVPAVVVRVPPASLALEVATVTPDGNVSVKPTPVNATVELGLVMVKVRLDVPFNAMVDGRNALLMVGGPRTVIVAVLLVVPVPPLAELTAPVVLFLMPAVVPVTVTVN